MKKSSAKLNPLPTTYLVDTENKQHLSSEELSKLKETDKLFLVAEPIKGKLNYYCIDTILHDCKAPVFIDYCCTGLQNSLDFQLSSLLGYLICLEPDRRYVIVSKDNGYLTLASYWKNKGALVHVCNNIGDTIERIFVNNEFDTQPIQSVRNSIELSSANRYIMQRFLNPEEFKKGLPEVALDKPTEAVTPSKETAEKVHEKSSEKVSEKVVDETTTSEEPSEVPSEKIVEETVTSEKHIEDNTDNSTSEAQDEPDNIYEGSIMTATGKVLANESDVYTEQFSELSNNWLAGRKSKKADPRGANYAKVLEEGHKITDALIHNCGMNDRDSYYNQLLSLMKENSHIKDLANQNAEQFIRWVSDNKIVAKPVIYQVGRLWGALALMSRNSQQLNGILTVYMISHRPQFIERNAEKAVKNFVSRTYGKELHIAE